MKQINDIVKSILQEGIISHPHMNNFPSTNNYIKVEFDDGNWGVKNKLCQKVLLQVYIFKLHIDMLSTDSTGFSMAYDDKGPFCISDSDLWLILPPRLQNGWEVCIQTGTCQESLNHSHKIWFISIK